MSDEYGTEDCAADMRTHDGQMHVCMHLENHDGDHKCIMCGIEWEHSREEMGYVKTIADYENDIRRYTELRRLATRIRLWDESRFWHSKISDTRAAIARLKAEGKES